MSAQLENLRREADRLHEDLSKQRMRSSDACKELITYCQKNEAEDPFHPNCQKPNPLKQKQGGCIII